MPVLARGLTTAMNIAEVRDVRQALALTSLTRGATHTVIRYLPAPLPVVENQGSICHLKNLIRTSPSTLRKRSA